MIELLTLLAATVETREPADKSERLLLATYASCIVDHKPNEARQAIIEDWKGDQLAYKDLLREERCVGGMEYKFPAATFKAAMAGTLIRRDLAGIDPATITTAPALSYDMPDPVKTVDDKGRPLSARSIEKQQEAVAGKVRWVLMAQFGECVARLSPATVPVLSNTVTGSEAELAALKQLAPHMPGCLPTGVKLSLDHSTLRGSVTLAYYRLAMAARQAKESGAAN